MHLHPYYRRKLGTEPGLCPVAEKAYHDILSLPIFPSMSDDDVAYCGRCFTFNKKLENMNSSTNNPVSEPESHVFFRVDAGPKIGGGHLKRCISLAYEFVQRGNKISFVGNGIAEIGDKEFVQLKAEVDKMDCQPGDEEDIRLTTELVKGDSASSNSCLVVDGYSFDVPYLTQLKERGIPVILVDDMANLSSYPVDIVINQNIGAENLQYPVEDSTKFLLGLDYVMLRDEFFEFF